MAISPLASALLRHLEEHRPKQVAAMEAAGTLDDHLEATAIRISEMEESLWKQGLHRDQIAELTRELAYPPAEEDDEPR